MKKTLTNKSNIKRKRTHGFRRKMRSADGRKVIKRRRRKGRKQLTVWSWLGFRWRFPTPRRFRPKSPKKILWRSLFPKRRRNSRRGVTACAGLSRKRFAWSSGCWKTKFMSSVWSRTRERSVWRKQKRPFMRYGRRGENFFVKFLVLPIIQAVSNVFRALGWRACRFYPSCSCYAREALMGQSFFKAVWLVIYRILRCHPFSAGGYDPVPTHGVRPMGLTPSKGREN